MSTTFKNQNGVSLIAAVFIIVVLAFMGVMFLTLVNTGSFSAVQDMQSSQALFIAEGGLQYTLAFNRNNIPNYSTHGIWTNLGVGQFKVDTPYLTAAVAVGATSLSVDSTDNFPATGRITIDNEFIQYTAKNDVTDTFTVIAVTAAHNQYNSVYPAARFSGFPGAFPNNCNPLPTIPVDDNPGGFQIPGIIFIDTEYFYCTGMDTVAPGYSFQNCQRCYGNSPPAAHPPNRFASQYALTSTGTVPSISGSAERIVRINAGPYDD